MFEGLGGFESDTSAEKHKQEIPRTPGESMIPGMLDDPRLAIKKNTNDDEDSGKATQFEIDVLRDRIRRRENEGEEYPAPADIAARAEMSGKIDKKVHQRFISRVSKFISKNADNPNLDSEAAQKVVSGLGLKPDSPAYERLMREANLLLGIKTRDTRDRNRDIEKVRKSAQEERRGEVMHKNETRKAKMKFGNEIVARNEGDIRWIDEIKDYIRENKDDPDNISNFWRGFDEICRSRKGREVTQFEFGDLQRTRNGILCELAAEDLFQGRQQFQKEKMLAESGHQSSEEIRFTTRKATPEEDAKLKTDFFVSFELDGETVELPVQVKSDYSEGHWNKDKEFSESNICSAFSPFKTKEGNQLDQQRFKFFKTNPLGFFVILPHGYDKLKIAEDGMPSVEMQELFNKKLDEQLPMLLNKIRNIRALEAKQSGSKERR
jgi:hypothetical protein